MVIQKLGCAFVPQLNRNLAGELLWSGLWVRFVQFRVGAWVKGCRLGAPHLQQQAGGQLSTG